MSARHRSRLDWLLYEADELILSHAATLLVLQGMPLSGLFPPDGHFRCGEERLGGPFLLVRGGLAGPDDPPLRLKSAAWVTITRRDETLTDDEVLGAILQEVVTIV